MFKVLQKMKNSLQISIRPTSFFFKYTVNFELWNLKKEFELSEFEQSFALFMQMFGPGIKFRLFVEFKNVSLNLV